MKYRDKFWYITGYLRSNRFSSLENCYLFVYKEAKRHKDKELLELLGCMQRSIRGFDTMDVEQLLQDVPDLEHTYRRWVSNELQTREISMLREVLQHIEKENIQLKRKIKELERKDK